MKDPSYTEKYEYVCNMINLYLDRELDLKAADKHAIFDENSFMFSFFTTDYSTLRNDGVYKEIVQRLEKSNKDENREYQFALTRLKMVYVDICAALGYKFVRELTDNIINGLLDITGIVDRYRLRASRKRFQSFFEAYPHVILCVVGNKSYFRALLVERQHSLNLGKHPTNP